ncbi:hypothetical protein GQX74_012260 [Glossina fuscipes]|nr:hypothetical protein GQX74_012260 [Glossina fuscipes]
MDQVCEKIGLEMGPICLNWLLQATDRCTKLAFGHISQGFNLLKSVKELFFSGAENVTVSVHPSRIKVAACSPLIKGIITDYTQRNLRYLADLEANAMLMRVITSFFGLMILAAFTLMLIYINGKIKKPLKRYLFSRDCKKKLTRLLPERIIHKHKSSDKRQMKVGNHLPSVSSSIMALRMHSKTDLLKIIISNRPQAAGRFYGSQDNHFNHLKMKYELKTQVLKKALNFLGENVKQLLVFIVIDEDPVYGDDSLPTSSPSLSPISTGTDSSQQSCSPRATINPSRRGSLRKSLFTLGSALPVATNKERKYISAKNRDESIIGIIIIPSKLHQSHLKQALLRWERPTEDERSSCQLSLLSLFLYGIADLFEFIAKGNPCLCSQILLLIEKCLLKEQN